jgi:hypothetical protein
MRIIDCKQGSPEWQDARLGLPTASGFDRIITPSGNPSKGATKYLAQCFAEWYLGVPLDDFQSAFMERGTEMEPEARRWYEFAHDAEALPVGFCLTDDGRAGASPDSLIGEDGLLEIKCPAAVTHAVYLLGGLTDEYKIQVQGQLWVTGRAWCDLLCYHPTMPRVVTRIERDEPFIEAMGKYLTAFCDRLDEAKAQYAEKKAEADTTRTALAPEDDPFATMEYGIKL